MPRQHCSPANTQLRKNLKWARRLWPQQIGKLQADALKTLTENYLFSVAGGDLQLLNGKWYVNHSGLLRLADRRGCIGVQIQPIREFCDPQAGRWAFKATVYKSRTCKGFVGYGDADPSNVSDLVRGAEMRVAETRAVNRALRKAYGIGFCSAEEIGSFSGRVEPASPVRKLPQPPSSKGNGHRLRDRLCLLIRQHQLDPALVKAYAVNYCDVSELRQASREQVATFITHLAEYAQTDREGLLCQLNSYAKPASDVLVTIANDSMATDPEKVAGAA